METVVDAQTLRRRLEEYVADKPFRLNPDDAVVDRVVRGLAKRLETTGRATCPCRLATGDAEADKAIVCPCVYHEEEIEAKGVCHCMLFVANDTEGTA